MLSAIAELLPLAVTFHCLGMLSAITLPVVRVVGPPLAEAVAANLAVLRIRYDLLPVVLGAPLPLAYRLAADRLTGLKLRRLKGLLAVAAAAFTHSAVVALCPLLCRMENSENADKRSTGRPLESAVSHAADLETAVETAVEFRMTGRSQRTMKMDTSGGNLVQVAAEKDRVITWSFPSPL